MSVTSRSVAKLLTSPSKVAHALDWKKVSGSILSMSISSDRIDLAVASHPSGCAEDTLDTSAQSLPSIPLKTEIVNRDGKKNQRILSPAVAEELQDIMNDWKVCGVVVNWPVQKEGWCGAPCGKVLYTLDQLASSSQQNVLSPNRPICLWDEEHHVPFEDEWGRSPVYSEPCEDKTVHIASEEQYQAPSTVALDVWNDFCRAHWPELYYNSYTTATSASSSWSAGKKNLAAIPKTPSKAATTVDVEWLDSYEDTAAYTKAAL